MSANPSVQSLKVRHWSRAALAAGAIALMVGLLPMAAPTARAAETLSPDVAAGLTFMREEEKLAHDVYVTLAEKWGIPVFSRISVAEERHASAVVTLLDGYGIEDPAATLPVGKFSDSSLQALYDSLVAQGSRSLADALAVGALIEETDIADLDIRLGAAPEANVQAVYTHLRAGSVNHLRAFTHLIQVQTGTAYQPQVLNGDAYATIVSANGPGRAWRGGRP